jgi:hypothetical protein
MLLVRLIYASQSSESFKLEDIEKNSGVCAPE